MAGTWQHYLPASFLARFADTKRKHSRDSLLWVGRRSVPCPYTQTAERVAAAKNIYTLAGGPWKADAVDQIFGAYEGQIGVALDLFLKPPKHVDAEMWLTHLVPFVAHIFVRDIDFATRQTAADRAVNSGGRAVALSSLCSRSVSDPTLIGHNGRREEELLAFPTSSTGSDPSRAREVRRDKQLDGLGQ
jgi:hypothetical protein